MRIPCCTIEHPHPHPDRYPGPFHETDPRYRNETDGSGTLSTTSDVDPHQLDDDIMVIYVDFYASFPFSWLIFCYPDPHHCFFYHPVSMHEFLFIKSCLDHFTFTTDDKFPQKYLVNNTWWSKEHWSNQFNLTFKNQIRQSIKSNQAKADYNNQISRSMESFKTLIKSIINYFETVDKLI